MIISSDVQKQENEVLVDIKKNESLRSTVQKAKFRNIVDGGFNFDGSSHLFMALQGLWTTYFFEDFQMTFGTDVSQPFIDYEAASFFMVYRHRQSLLVKN